MKADSGRSRGEVERETGDIFGRKCALMKVVVHCMTDTQSETTL